MARIEVNLSTGEVQELPDDSPPRTTAEKIAEEAAGLNAVLQANLATLEQQYVKALLADGTAEASKVSAMRAQQAALKAQYASDYAAILAKYPS